MPENSANILLDWLKNAHVIVQGHTTVGVRAAEGDRREYQNITWPELERGEANPLIPPRAGGVGQEKLTLHFYWSELADPGETRHR